MSARGCRKESGTAGSRSPKQLAPARRPALEALEARLLLSAGGQADSAPPAPLAAEARGTVWYDADRDGLRGAGEVALPGRTVYIDLNDNGSLDSTGTTALPSTDVPRSIADFATAESALPVSGLVGAIRDINITLSLTHTWDGDLDAFLTSPAGTVVVLFDGVGGSGDGFLNTTFDDEAAVDIDDGTAPFTGSFRPAGSLADFDGEDPNGTWTLSVHDGFGGDVGSLDAWSLTVETAEPAAVTDDAGEYAFPALDAGTYHLRLLDRTGWTQTHPADDHTAVLADGETLAGLDFGTWAKPGSISGRAWHDGDRDGVLDAHEPPLEARQVFLDYNANGAADPGEPSALTDPDGTYAIADIPPRTHVVAQVLPVGWEQSLPADPAGQDVAVGVGQAVGGVDFGSHTGAEVQGSTWYDADEDGLRDVGEAPLEGWVVYLDLNGNAVRDADEPFDATDADGTYAIGVVPGDYTLRVELAEGWTQSAPAGGAGQAVTVASGEVVTGVDFGAFAPTRIRGVKWNDIDHDGTRDPGEGGLGGWRIYLDINNDGQWNTGEPFDITADDGSYEISALAAGTYLVAEEPQPGWTQSFPAAGAGAAAARPPALAEARAALLASLTTTGSKRRVHAAGVGSVVTAELLADSPLRPDTNVSGPLIDIDAFRADPRFAGIDGTGWAVVVIDTGVDVDHSFFGPDADGDGIADRIVYQWDFADNDADASDGNGHGTNVTSIVASQDATYTGLAPGADIIVLKVLDSTGNGSFSDIEQALQWVVANAAAYNIASVNMSLGDGANYSTATSMFGLGDELAALAAMDVVVASASGNDFYTHGSAQGASYPAADANSLSIGAVWDGNNGGPFNWSSGATDFSTGADRVTSFSQRSETLTDVFAPGARITGAGRTGGLSTYSGTSQATPHIAGIVALAQQMADMWLGRRLTVAEVRDLLRGTAETIFDGDDEDDNVTNTNAAYPRVNVYALAEELLAMGRSDVHRVTLALGETIEGVDFGNFRSAEAGGTVWYDANQDGIRQEAEAALEGRRVFADINGSGSWDAAEAYAITGPDGSWRLALAAPQTVTLRLEPRAGWTQTHPAGGAGLAVTVGPGDTVGGLAFGSFAPTAVRGTVWYDADRSGTRDAGEVGLGGRKVFVDADADAAWDAGETFTLTAEDGTWELANLAPGTHTLRLETPAGWVQTSPAAAHSVTLTGNETVEGIDFGTWAQTEVSGTAWYDADQDAARGPAEPPLPGWRIYADLNGSAAWDAGEPSVLTDSDGRYALRNLAPGSYTIRRQSQPGWAGTFGADGHLVTVAVGSPVTGRDFGTYAPPARLEGTKWYDTDRDGTRDPGEAGLAGWTVFVDIDADGLRDAFEPFAVTAADGTYAVEAVPPGRFAVAEETRPGWQQTYPTTGAIYHSDFEIDDGGWGASATWDPVGDWQWGEPTSGPAAAFSGRNVWATRLDGDYTNASGTSFLSRHFDFSTTPTVELSWRQWVHVNYQWDTARVRVNNAIVYERTSSSPTADWELQTVDLSAWAGLSDVLVRFELYATDVVSRPGWYIDDVTVLGTGEGVAHSITFAPGQTVTGIDFGNYIETLVSGSAWFDTDRDGARSAGEPAVPGRRIYADLDGNAAFSAGEPAAVTGEDGTYSLGIAPGTYILRQDLPPGWSQTHPASGGQTVSVAVGESVEGVDFGSYAPTRLRGVKWFDADRDGVRSPDEALLEGWRIYLDLNLDGAWNEGEPFDLTAPDGSYEITGIAPGSYILAEEARPGWTQSYPAPAGGSTASGAPASPTAEAAAALTTTASSRALYPAGIGAARLLPGGAPDGPAPATNVSGPLIGLDRFRADPRFAGIDGSGFAVAVLDTGLDLDHPFFGPDADGDGTADRIVFSWDFADGDADASDHNGHGSNVTSIAAGADATFPGMAPGADIVHLKVFRDDDTGMFAMTEQALQWVVANAAAYNIVSVNLSLGDGENYTQPTGLYGLDDELAALAAAGVTVVASAGNAFFTTGGATGVGYPAADPNALAVGAVWDGDNGGPFHWSDGATDFTTGPDRIMSFSQRHATLTDIFAPGGAVTGADADGGTGTFYGTSQAAPHITGIVALLQQLADQKLGRRLTVAEVRDILARSAVTVFDGDDEDDNVTNSLLDLPRVDVPAAAEEVLAMGLVGTHRVTVSLGQTLDGLDFGNFQSAEVRGTVWYDADQDAARDAGEGPLPGRRIYADTNGNAAWDAGEPVDTSAEDGTWALAVPAPGSYIIRQEPLPGWTQTHPADGHGVTVAIGDAVSGADFGNFAVGSVTGTKWYDADRDGLRDAGEPPLSGWRIYADADENGTWDDGEPFDITAADGSYRLADLRPGLWRIGEEAREGWVQVHPVGAHVVDVPAGGTAGGVDFGNWAPTRIAGTVWYDADRDGARQAGEVPLPDWNVFLDLNGNGVADFASADVASAEVPRDILDHQVALSSIVLAGIEGVVRDVNVTLDITHTYDGDLRAWLQGPSGATVELFASVGDGGQNFTATTFDDEAAVSISQGVAPFTGRYRPAEPLAGFDGQPVAGQWTLFVEDTADIDQGTLNSWSLAVEYGEPIARSGLDGRYLFDNLQPGAYVVREILPAGWTRTWPTEAHVVTVGPAETVDGMDFGNWAPAGRIEGLQWHDVDRDGLRDAGEGPLAGWKVYLDLNVNGRWDDGEPFDLTDATGAFTFASAAPREYVVAEVPQADWIQTFPGGGIAARLFVVDGLMGQIVELDPADGAELGRLPLPEPSSLGPDGLAFDGRSLWFASGSHFGGSDRLYEIDPDTGAVRDVDDFASVGLTGGIDGLAVYGGQVVAYDALSHEMFFVDPLTDRVTGSWTAPVPGIGGLAGAGARGSLFLTDSAGRVIYELDAADGAVRNSLPDPLAGSLLGLAFVDGALLAGDSDSGRIVRMDPDSGEVQATFPTTMDITALGGDDASGAGPFGAGGQTHRVDVLSGGTVSGIDFASAFNGVTPPPAAPDLLGGSDTGVLDDDNVTRLDNAAADRTLSFLVAGTLPGATVELFADGVRIGSAVADAAQTTIVTSGAHPLADGPHAITARQTRFAVASEPSEALTVVVDTIAPRLTGFGLASGSALWSAGVVDSSTWTAPGRTSRTAPWAVIDRLVADFDEPVAAAAGSLTVTGVLAGPLAVAAPTGGPAARLTWATASPLADDRYTVKVLSGPGGVTDVAGNALDGEPAGPGQPSGDGLPGGDWQFALNVLHADIDGDGRVSVRDRRDLRDRFGLPAGFSGYDILADLDGSGRIDTRDRRILRDNYGGRLPVAASAAASARIHRLALARLARYARLRASGRRVLLPAALSDILEAVAARTDLRLRPWL